MADSSSRRIDTTNYGSVLQTKQLVPIKGVGELFSGLYYVTSVKHVFTMDITYSNSKRVAML